MVALISDIQISTLRLFLNAQGQMLNLWAEADEDLRKELWSNLHQRAEEVWEAWDTTLNTPKMPW